MGDVAGPGGGGANVSAGGLGFGGDIGHGDVGHGSGQVDPGLAAAAGGPGAGSGLGQSVGSASAGGAGGEAEAERSIAAFRSAIAKALGLSQIDREVTYGAPAQPGSPALEAHDMDTDAVRDALEAAGMFDDPSNTDYSDDSPAYDPDAVNRQVYGAPQALDDPQGTQEGLREAELAAIGKRTVGAHPSRDPRIGMPIGTGRPTTTRDIENREVVDMYGRVAPIEDIEDPEERAAAYEMLGKLQKAAQEARTPWGRALNTIMGYGINAVPGMGQLNMIGKAVKAGLAKAGFNVDPNIIGQAIRAAHEVTTQGPMGAGGTPIGARDDAFIEEFLRNVPASGYQEPWMKGLTERQIQYYLNRPSELEWVRNLWNRMNPSGGMGQ